MPWQFRSSRCDRRPGRRSCHDDAFYPRGGSSPTQEEQTLISVIEVASRPKITYRTAAGVCQAAPLPRNNPTSAHGAGRPVGSADIQ